MAAAASEQLTNTGSRRCCQGAVPPTTTQAVALYIRHPPHHTLSSWMSLSMPLGPSVVRTVSARAMQALMLLTSWGVPWLVSVPSLSRMI